MALQLRRGTDAERSAVTFADGELVYTTDTKKLYVGDGATAGGNSITALTTTLDGDLTGSVFGDDSTLIVDGVNNKLVGEIETTDIKLFKGTSPELNIAVSSSTDLSTYAGQLGEILFQTQGSDGEKTYGIINSYTTGIIFAHNDNGTSFPADTLNTFTKTGAAIGGINPTARLDVRGDIIASKSITPGIYTNATARDTDITSPTQGMTIFNIALQKFQGYVSDTGLAGGAASNSTPGWINLN